MVYINFGIHNGVGQDDDLPWSVDFHRPLPRLGVPVEETSSEMAGQGPGPCFDADGCSNPAFISAIVPHTDININFLMLDVPAAVACATFFWTVPGCVSPLPLLPYPSLRNSTPSRRSSNSSCSRSRRSDSGAAAVFQP